MTEDLLSKYYDLEELDRMLQLLAMEIGYMICATTKKLAETNENWCNEELVDNMVEADRQLMKRFCEILLKADENASIHAAEKTREKYGI